MHVTAYETNPPCVMHSLLAVASHIYDPLQEKKTPAENCQHRCKEAGVEGRYSSADEILIPIAESSSDNE